MAGAGAKSSGLLISMDTEHQLSAIRQIAITVSDVSMALPFYRDVLALMEEKRS